jgi:hypothetical protein
LFLPLAGNVSVTYQLEAYAAVVFL